MPSSARTTPIKPAIQNETTSRYSDRAARGDLCKPKAMKFTSMAEVPPNFGKSKHFESNY